MRIGLFHGYELTGSGSNEYTRYLARALAEQGHEVHVLCREPKPEAAGVDAAIAWDASGAPTPLFGTPGGVGTVTLHRLPHADIRPVYVTDKQREGNVKAYPDLTDEELREVRGRSRRRSGCAQGLSGRCPARQPPGAATHHRRRCV